MGATQPWLCQWWHRPETVRRECNNFHHCVAHHAILYFSLAILINYSANLNIWKNKVWPDIRKIVQMFSGKCRVVQRATQQRKSGRSSMHSFRAVSSAAKPRSSDSHIVPTSLDSSGLTPWFTCANKSHQLSMDWKKPSRTWYTWFQSRWSKTQWAISTKNAMPANKLKATTLSLFCNT